MLGQLWPKLPQTRSSVFGTLKGVLETGPEVSGSSQSMNKQNQRHSGVCILEILMEDSLRNSALQISRTSSIRNLQY